MSNKTTLILSTTKAVSSDGRFSHTNSDIEAINVSETNTIYRLKGELIFARSLIVLNEGDKKPDVINKEIIVFTQAVLMYLNDKEPNTNIDRIIYFIHGKEFQFSNRDYKRLTSSLNQVKLLKRAVKKLNTSDTKKIKEVEIVVYNHSQRHFWGKFLYKNKTLKKHDTTKSWTDNIVFFFEEKEQQENKYGQVKPLNDNTIQLIDDLVEKDDGTKYTYDLKTCENKEITTRHSSVIGGSKPDFQIINTSMGTFLDKDYLNQLATTLWFNATLFIPIPTIIVGEYDIMCDRTELEDINKKNRLDSLELNKRYRFFDASIWVRYVSIEENERKETLAHQLKRVIGEIKEQLNNRTYEANVAREHLEYHYRLFQNSFLQPIGGHATAITPFVFHSETYMEKKADELIQKFRANKIQWDLLLVDDFADSKLTIGDKQQEATRQETEEKKYDIIYRLLNKKTDSQQENTEETTTEKSTFEIISTTTVDDAIKKLEHKSSLSTYPKHFDVILLDYLFSKGLSKEEVKYGTDFLNAIDTKTKLKGAKSFNYKFWIYPVSVFSDALHSSLREQGVQHLESDWILARGADPINTPQLFRHDFFDFISIQFNGIIYQTKEIIELFVSDDIEEDANNPIDVRSWARRLYHSLWTKFGKSESLIYRSAFSKSAKAYRDREKQSKSLEIFRYLETILHNLAFSSIFDFEGTEQTFLRLHEEVLKEADKLIKDEEVLFTTNDKKKLKKQLEKLGEGIYGIHN